MSSSVRDYTTFLIGYCLAEELADEAGPGREIDTFLKWEQLAAYARGGVNGDWAFMRDTFDGHRGRWGNDTGDGARL